MYLTKVVRDGVAFRLTHKAGMPGRKLGYVSYWLWSGFESKDFKGKREWKLPHTRTMKRLGRRFLGERNFRVYPKRNELWLQGFLDLDLKVGLSREDRAAFLAAIAVNTKITRVE
jgi:hypothetical protein